MINHFIPYAAFLLLFLSLIPCGVLCLRHPHSAVGTFLAWGLCFGMVATALLLLCFQNQASASYVWLSLGQFKPEISFQFHLYNSFLMLFMWGTYFCATGFLLVFRNLDHKVWSVFLFLLCLVGGILMVHAASVSAVALGFTLQSWAYYFLGTLKHAQGTWGRFAFSGLLIDFFFIFILISLSASHDFYIKWAPIFFVCLLSKHAFGIGLNFDRLFKGEGRFLHLGLHFSTFRLFVLTLWIKNNFPSIGFDFARWFFALGTFIFLSGALYSLSGEENSDSESLIRMYAGLCLFSLGLGQWTLLPEFLLIATSLTILHYQLGCFSLPLNSETPNQVASFLYSAFRWLCLIMAFIFILHIMHRASPVLGLIMGFPMGLFLMMQHNLKISLSVRSFWSFFSIMGFKKAAFVAFGGAWICLLSAWFVYQISWVQIIYFLQNSLWSWVVLSIIWGPMISRLIFERADSWIIWSRKQIGGDFIEKVEESFYTVYELLFINPFRKLSTFLSQSVDQFIFEDKLFSSVRGIVKAIDVQPLQFGNKNTSWYMLGVFVLLILFSLMFQIL